MPARNHRKRRRPSRWTTESVRSEIPSSGQVPTPYTLPARAWALFFFTTLERLNKVKPGWAEMTARQFQDFHLSWVMSVPHGEGAREALITNTFKEIDATRFGPGEFKGPDAISPRLQLLQHRRIDDGYFTADPAEIERRIKAFEPVARARRWSDAQIAEHAVFLRSLLKPPQLPPRRKLSYRKSRSALQQWADVSDPPRRPGRPRKRPK
jgi:hypothetical protein